MTEIRVDTHSHHRHFHVRIVLPSFRPDGAPGRLRGRHLMRIGPEGLEFQRLSLFLGLGDKFSYAWEDLQEVNNEVRTRKRFSARFGRCDGLLRRVLIRQGDPEVLASALDQLPDDLTTPQHSNAFRSRGIAQLLSGILLTAIGIGFAVASFEDSDGLYYIPGGMILYGLWTSLAGLAELVTGRRL